MDGDAAGGTMELSSTGLQRGAVMAEDDDGEHGTHVTDLPTVVLASILAHLADPVDVMATLCTCRLFWFLVRTAPFRLRLRPRQFDETPAANSDDTPPMSGRVTPLTAGSWTRAALGAIQIHMCATRELDLAGCYIVDEDVTAILLNMRCLERLILDNCQKLTGAVADVLAASVKSGPRSLSLQRCFGLGSSSTVNLLVASAVDGSRLQSILLSHIDSLDIHVDDLSVQRTGVYECERDATWNDSDFAKYMGNISSGSGLRILALHNCAGLTASNLTSVAMLCPHLELLLLGGSVQALGLSRVEAISEDTVSATVSTLVRVIELLSKLRVLELTFFTTAVVRAVRVQDKRKIQIWDLCDVSSVAAAAWVLDGLEKVKSRSAVNDILRHIASPVHSLNSPPGQESAPVSPVSFSKSIRAQFWQDGLTLSDCLGTGSFAYTNFNSSWKLASLFNFPQNEAKWESSTEDVASALRGSANCSDVRKRTPLHMAAARGDVPMIAGLLAIGAVAVGMKDSSGGTALFVAAESGYAQACELLLQGGADVLASNRAGETPLYIAALRGHSAAVGIMLAHCHERGVNWQDADVYGMPLLPHIVPSFGGRNFARRSLKMYSGIGLPCQSLQAKPGSGCFSRLWEPASSASHGSQVGDRSLASQILSLIALEWPTSTSRDLIVAGDGWTPLMAATVADRQNVGEMLLGAAGHELGLDAIQKGQLLMSMDSTIFEGANKVRDLDVAFIKNAHDAIVTLPIGDCKPVEETLSHVVGIAEDMNSTSVSQQLLRFLNRQNRYGQTALHIAAQKGSVWFIERLLSAGASLDVPNAYGFRAVDVAKRYKQTAVADRLRAWESSQLKDASIPGGKKSRKARRNKGRSNKVADLDQEPSKLHVDCSADCSDAGTTVLDTLSEPH